MAKVIFYEKPGCAGNARQKALLIGSGHELEVRDLRAEPWTAASLRPFFGAKPVNEWFNASSPRIKAAEVKPSELSPEAALSLMIDDPLLIRRPLMQVGDRRESGFNQARVEAWIGLRPTASSVTDACLKSASPEAPPICRTAEPVKPPG